MSVIAPAGAAGLGDFRSTAHRLAKAGLAEFIYYEVPFQTRDAPARIVDALRDVYRSCSAEATRHCAVAIIRGGGASADLAWLVDQKLVEAICRMNVPVITGIGHERDRNLLDEVACIACDTPSKVVEHIRSTIVGAALDGQRAREAIRTSAEQIINRTEVAVALNRTAIDRDARETLRLAEATVRGATAGLEPGARALLDATQAALASARGAVERHARETVRLAETTVRTTATGLEPGARALLDDARAGAVAAMESTRSASRRRTELAMHAVQSLRWSATSNVEAALRPLEVGAGKAISEIGTRLEAVPRVASEGVARLRRQVIEDADRSAHIAGERVVGMRREAIDESGRSLDGLQSAIAIIRERADALDPRSVLAAGYTILRDRAGEPLTGVAAVRRAGLVTAELRDGTTGLRSLDMEKRGSEPE